MKKIIYFLLFLFLMQIYSINSFAGKTTKKLENLFKNIEAQLFDDVKLRINKDGYEEIMKDKLIQITFKSLSLINQIYRNIKEKSIELEKINFFLVIPFNYSYNFEIEQLNKNFNSAYQEWMINYQISLKDWKAKAKEIIENPSLLKEMIKSLDLPIEEKKNTNE